MKITSLDRVLALVAAAGFSASEFKALLSEIKAVHPDDLVRAYTHARTQIRTIHVGKYDDDLSSDSFNTTGVNPIIRDMLSIIESSDASQAEAGRRLWRRLADFEDPSAIPEFSPKDGLARWLRRVMQVVPANMLLNITIAEFSERDGPRSDRWRLSGDE